MENNKGKYESLICVSIENNLFGRRKSESRSLSFDFFFSFVGLSPLPVARRIFVRFSQSGAFLRLKSSLGTKGL